MNEEKNIKRASGWWALSPLLVFLCLYLATSIIVNDFYKVPITVAFLVSSCYAIAITKGLKLDQRIYQFSVGASNKNIMLMVCRSFCPKRQTNGCHQCNSKPHSTYTSGQPTFSRYLYSFLLHFALYRYQCRNNRSSYSGRYRIGTKNRNRYPFHGSHRSRRFFLWR